MYGFELPMRTDVFSYLMGGRFNKKSSKITQVKATTATQTKTSDSYNFMLRSQLYHSSSCSLSTSESSYSLDSNEPVEHPPGSLLIPSKEEVLQQKIHFMQDLGSLDQKELLDLIGMLFEQDQKSPAITALYLRNHCENLNNSAIRYTVANQLHARHNLKAFVNDNQSRTLREKIAQLKACLEVDQEKPTAIEWSRKINGMMEKNLLKAIEYLWQSKIEALHELSLADLVAIKNHLLAAEGESVTVLTLQIVINSHYLHINRIREEQQYLLDNHLEDLKVLVPQDQQQQFESMAIKLATWLENYKDGTQAKHLCLEINELIHDKLLKHVKQFMIDYP